MPSKASNVSTIMKQSIRLDISVDIKHCQTVSIRLKVCKLIGLVERGTLYFEHLISKI